MAINDALLAVDCVGGQETHRTNGDRLTLANKLYRERLSRLLEEADAA
ncbi:MAG: hypothetical protein ACXWF9_00250 [Solirubrobacterales bacterium]